MSYYIPVVCLYVCTSKGSNSCIFVSLFLGYAWMSLACRRVPEAFYRVRTLEGILGVGPGVKPCDRTRF